MEHDAVEFSQNSAHGPHYRCNKRVREPKCYQRAMVEEHDDAL